MTPRPPFRAAVLVVLAAAVPALAVGSNSVDLQVRGNDKVTGTIRPSYDEECFTCDLPRDAVLVATLKRKSKTGPALQLALRESGADVPGTVFVTKPTGVSLQPFTVPVAGTYRLCVTSGDGVDGDYEISVSWKSKTQWKDGGEPLAASDSATFEFDAPAGATAMVAITPASHSPFVAQLGNLTGPEGFAHSLGTVSPRTGVALPRTGRYTVHFTNAGAEGAWNGTVKLKLRKTPKSRIDIRDGRLGGVFGDDHTVFGRAVGPDGGTFDLTATIGGPLGGTSISIPPGSLGAPTVITVSAAPPFQPGGGNHPAGPAVDFGPSGTVFDPSGSNLAKQATVTIPFDPAFFPGDTSSLVIYVRSADGTVTQVPPPYVIGSNTVTFTTSHFSTFQAAASGPRPLVGTYVLLEVNGVEHDGFGGQFGFGLHEISGDKSGTSVFIDHAPIAWTDKGGAGSSATLVRENQSVSVDVQIPDDQTVILVDQSDPTEPAKFHRGASDDVLVGVKHGFVALRRTPLDAVTETTMAGRWHLFHWQMNGRPQTTEPPSVSLEISGDTALVNLVPDGTVAFANIHSAEADTPYPTGTWHSKLKTEAPEGLTWSIPDGFVQLTIPDQNRSVNLIAALGGEVLIGRLASDGGQAPDDGPSSELFLLVRTSSGRKLGDVLGDYFVTGVTADTQDRTPTGQGMNFSVSTMTASLVKPGDLSVVGAEDHYFHDSQGMAGSELDDPAGGSPGRMTVRPDGGFSLAGEEGGTGAFTPNRALFVRAVFDGKQFELDFGTALAIPQR